jgi:hypothetical protein
MYRMYLAMKERSPEDITADDIAIASGKTVLDPVNNDLNNRNRL